MMVRVDFASAIWMFFVLQVVVYIAHDFGLVG